MNLTSFRSTEDGRSMTTFYFCILCKSSIWFTEKHIFKIIIYFFNKSKCAANYVISFEVYDNFIRQKILKLWRQESRPFGPGWAANITSICSWPDLPSSVILMHLYLICNSQSNRTKFVRKVRLKPGFFLQSEKINPNYLKVETWWPKIKMSCQCSQEMEWGCKFTEDF